VALLRAFQPEARSLVRQALDILTPALDKRLPSSDPWIRWTKKILVEEGHSLPQLIHILQLLTRCFPSSVDFVCFPSPAADISTVRLFLWCDDSRHPTLFYRCRSEFVTHIVHSLSRIGLLPNSSPENRRLAVDLVELILTWEKQRLDAVRPAPASTGTSSSESDNRPSGKHDGAFSPFTCAFDKPTPSSLVGWLIVT
jgi:transformation/transcription domain-associated protein